MRFEKKITWLLILVLVFSACNSEQKTTNQKGSLDIASFLKYADGNKIYPSEKQIEILKAVMPKEAFQPAPSIKDRKYWSKIAKTPSGKSYLEKAISLLSKAPEVPITDEIYRRANKEGNRQIYKPRYYRTMDRLEHFILAECIENKGQFIPQINIYVQAIMDMKSWLHPNHDDRDNTVLEGKRMTIDLGARKFGSVLVLAKSLLGDVFSREIQTQITTELQRRITDSYLKSTKRLDKNNTWIDGTSNWNSVCTSGSVFVSITNAQNSDERLGAIGAAINGMKYYLSGFGADGYCSEGLGYWGYGFSHYLYLAQIIHEYTDGKVNMFEGEDFGKLKRVGNFPEHFEIQNGTCAPFADGVSHTSSKGSNFANVLSSKYYGAIKPTEIRFEEAVEQIIAWNNPELFSPNTEVSQAATLENHTYFEDFGMIISRGKQKTPFSIAVKAGHNAENHNHSDVGTYILVLDEDLISGDIGAPSYRAGSFSPHNKARSSWGHPVPIINGKLQSNGIQFKGEIIETVFSETSDKVVMDLKPAYELSMLNSLKRTMINDKTHNGIISIKDDFVASENVDFGTAIMTYSNYEILNATTLILSGKSQKVKVEIKSTGGKVTFNPEPVPVKHLREGKDAKRIGIDFENKLKKGTITIIYTPILSSK